MDMATDERATKIKLQCTEVTGEVFKLDCPRVLAQVNCNKGVETSSARPHHPPARSRRLAAQRLRGESSPFNR
jgi:hypothetical protein